MGQLGSRPSLQTSPGRGGLGGEVGGGTTPLPTPEAPGSRGPGLDKSLGRSLIKPSALPPAPSHPVWVLPAVLPGPPCWKRRGWVVATGRIIPLSE